DPLTFAKVSGPDWLSVAENGALSGTPLQSDVGDYQALFSVTDGIAPPVEVAARGTVKNTNDLPRWTEDPVRLGVAIEDTQYFFDLKTKVTDEENDPLTFRKVSGPAWLTLTPEGALGGTPSQS